jgi:mono/diheme cytochrome c family protein
MQTNSALVAAAVSLALVMGGIFTTAAWLYQSGGREAEARVEAMSTPIAPVITAPPPHQGATTPNPSLASNADAGRQVYAQFCDSCHPNGGQGVGPSVRGTEFHAKYAEDAKLRKLITEGTGRMPGFRQLGNQQLDDLIAYIRTLN